ncbi:MAG: SDR family NAD(P)-dependent oxidoreductase, partial [Limnobacter sp.]|nr:SDR family NAD(P)-dependent oxidoreductase [Limnobacter sp.]
TRYDCRDATAALEGSGISCPDLADYAWAVWDYWERHLDPDLFVDRSLSGQVKGKVVLITGGSSGIGLATAQKMAAAGAKTIICGRDPEKLAEAQALVKAEGNKLYTYAVDIANYEDCDKFVHQVLKDFGCVDILVNNAGRSIRRGIENSFDRFHDLERTMQLNYFGALRVTYGLLPAMMKQRRGQVINISSIGVLTNAPRFSAYVASKGALDSWTRCAASEFADLNIKFTTINMPLVRTPMIAPTKLYNNVPTLSPEDAADLVAQAVIHKPVRIATRLGVFGQVLHAVVPKTAQIIMNTSFRMFPDSQASSKRSRPLW